MKKHAICIQCHNKPEQINQIIDFFDKDCFDIFIHVDKKSDILDKINQLTNVYFCTRHDVKWGRFSQVEATIELLNSLDETKYSYIHLISGNDFPIKNSRFIYEKLNESNKEFIECNKLPEMSTWSWGGLDRYLVYYPQWIIHRPNKKIMRVLRVLYREFIMRTKIFQRKKRVAENFYGGSSWFSLTGNCVSWIKKYLKNNQNYINYFKHGICVDEIFFSTLVQMSPYKNNITNDPYRFMIWKGSTSGGPFELKKENIPDMIASKNIFARKITNIEVINEIRKYLENEESYEL